MNQNFERAKSEYPDISDLELHFYNMKSNGITDSVMEAGGERPIFYIYDDNNFGLISFMFSENSPYRTENGRILFNGHKLDFNSLLFTRLGNQLPYYYFRGPNGMFPSLHDDRILNVNFHPKCGGCDFCQYGYRTEQLGNISSEEGFNRIKEETKIEDLGQIKEIAIVTGRFGSEDSMKKHVLDVISSSEERGFKGRIFYMGSELMSNASLSEILKRLGNNPERLRYAYTIEKFFNRSSIMHGIKGTKTYPEILEEIKYLNGTGLIGKLEYTYIVGVEDFDDFKRGSLELAEIALPHLSILRRTGQNSNLSTICRDYSENGAYYTCQVRKHYEELYGGKILGNNFANLWTFPLNQFDLSLYLDSLMGVKKVA